MAECAVRLRNAVRAAPPFGADATGYASVPPLNSVIGPTAAAWSFTYDPSGSGELTRLDFPDGGHIRWTYGTATYNGGRSMRPLL